MSEKKPTRQEQEPANEEITEIAPGVLRSMLPANLPGLGHVNCYLLEDERGLAIVDPGLPGPESYKALLKRLKVAGYEVENVHTVIITHSHFDHFGGAERVKAEAGAEIVTHENFRVLWGGGERREHLGGAEGAGEERGTEEGDAPFWPEGEAKTPWGTDRKLPVKDEDLKRWKKMGIDDKKWFRTPAPTLTLADTEVVKLARREWVAVFTPGHTFDHLCLYDPEHGLMIFGDHVLPTITPHIAGAQESEDPLTEFFKSLEKMADYSDVKIALPAHGHPFEDLPGRAQEIIEHHEQRLDVIRKSAKELGQGTVEEYMERLFKPRSWGTMAESETYAHLLHLLEQGEVIKGEKEGLATFQLAD